MRVVLTTLMSLVLLVGCKDWTATVKPAGEKDVAAAKNAQAQAQALAGLTGPHKANAEVLAKAATGTPVKPAADKNAAEAGAIDTGAKGVVKATTVTLTEAELHRKLADAAAKAADKAEADTNADWWNAVKFWVGIALTLLMVALVVAAIVTYGALGGYIAGPIAAVILVLYWWQSFAKEIVIGGLVLVGLAAAGIVIWAIKNKLAFKNLIQSWEPALQNDATKVGDALKIVSGNMWAWVKNMVRSTPTPPPATPPAK